MTKNKGFTLVELLIVVAILAVLSTATVLILDPANILRETRDAQRLNDMASISSAISLYLATAANPAFSTALDTAGNCTIDSNGATAVTPDYDGGTCTVTAERAVGATGWVNVLLANTSGGSPLSVLPMDPQNTVTNYYVFEADSATTKFELNANMESTKYAAAYEPTAKDGGDNTAVYEVGTNLTLL